MTLPESAYAGVMFSAGLRADDVLVTLHGEIDISATAEFLGLMEQALQRSENWVTVDMRGVSFLDSQGLAVLMQTARTLRSTGRYLRVRAPSRQSYRLFEVTGMLDILSVERPATDSALVEGLVSASTLPRTREVLDAALKMVVIMTHAVIEGADGVSITLPRQGKLGTVAYSNETVLQMDHDQYDTSEGPCVDAAHTGEHFFVNSLEQEERWPHFVPLARRRGIESILSTPLVHEERPIGALNVYSRQEGAFRLHEKEWADQFAREASRVVGMSLGGSQALLGRQLQEALTQRDGISLAQGILMEREAVSSAAAHVLLQDMSRQTSRPLHEVASTLITERAGRAR